MIVWTFIKDVWNSPHGSWILLCVLIAAVLFGWHEVTLRNAVARAHAEDQAAIDAANVKAQAEHDAKQALIDGKADTQNAAANAKLDAIARQTNSIAGQLAGLKRTAYKNALPADCLLDTERQNDANEALQR